MKDNKTIAQFLGITEFPYSITDNNGRNIYYEYSNGYWFKRKYDSKDNLIYYEHSRGFWYKAQFDSNGNKIYYEQSSGYWYKREYDSSGNEIYYEDSLGVISDNRPKIIELTLEQIAEKFGTNVSNIKIKK